MTTHRPDTVADALLATHLRLSDDAAALAAAGVHTLANLQRLAEVARLLHASTTAVHLQLTERLRLYRSGAVAELTARDGRDPITSLRLAHQMAQMAIADAAAVERDLTEVASHLDGLAEVDPTAALPAPPVTR